ncbi:retrovirus-related pol polyprotein from transposon TNT 1-94 [Tanacetum coccineum]|uniref:Retrovirus-related pol polyprotein from transposon TNT 1-94 n=1 Tax=Tanacetum coccineum TaxID=301880 RepID=A0ABQ5FP94_9ASTR
MFTHSEIETNELLESDKADFSNIYDLLLQECVSKDVTCSYLHSLSDLDAYNELQCVYVHKVKECECLAEKLSKQTGNIVQLILFIVDSGCIKHMTGNLKLLCNFVEKYLGTVRFGNVQFAPIIGYGDLVQGNITIKGNHVHQSPICFLANASPTQAWLWHRRLSHLNFDTINLLSKKDIMISLPKVIYVKDQLCSSCELGKAKRSTYKTKNVPSLKGRLNLLHMDFYRLMRIGKHLW